MRRRTIATATFLVAANAFAQSSAPPLPTWKDVIVKNLLPHHQLKVSDFPVNDRAHPDKPCWTRTFIQPVYHYVANQTGGGYWYVHVVDWTVFSGLDRNESSRRSKIDMKRFLPAAQAFLDLNEIYARKLAALTPVELPSGEGTTFEQARFQLDDRIAAFVRMQFLDAAQKEVDKIDNDTHHGQDEKKLRDAFAAIKKRLAETPRPPNMPDPNATAAAAPTLSPSRPISPAPAKP